MTGANTVDSQADIKALANQAELNRQANLLDQAQRAPVYYQEETPTDINQLISMYEKLGKLEQDNYEREFEPEKYAARQGLEGYMADLGSGELDLQTQNDLLKLGVIGATQSGMGRFKAGDNMEASRSIVQQIYGRGKNNEMARRMGELDTLLSRNPTARVSMSGADAANYEVGRRQENQSREMNKINTLLQGAAAHGQSSVRAGDQNYGTALQTATTNANMRNAADQGNRQAIFDGVGLALGTGGMLAASSMHIKEDIKYLKEPAIPKIMSASVRTYRYIDGFGPEGDQIGLLAEEAPQEITDMVKHPLKPEGVKAVNLYAMNALLWKAVQELILEVEKLKKQNQPKKVSVGDN